MTSEQDGDEGAELMEEILSRENLRRARDRVVSNKGAPGVDGMTVAALDDYLRDHWPSVRQQLLSGSYEPQPVRKVEIPKHGGGTRTLGIPTVLDRLIQQAVNQVLQRIFEPTFSDGSFGFRPGRSALDAVRRAREHVAGGKHVVVDLDLEKFFDRVNHDVLMARVGRRVKDLRVLRLIRRFLRAGMMEGGLTSPRMEGTPQGGPLSPLLSNILLDDLDRELTRRGHAFVRYADDCNVYVHTERAGQRVMSSLTAFLANELRLKVNRHKSAVARSAERQFLGYRITVVKGRARLAIAPSSVQRLKQTIRLLTREGRGNTLEHSVELLAPLLRGWIAFFRYTEAPSALEKLDHWIRRRLRMMLWRQWSKPKARYRRLCASGMDGAHAGWLVYRSHRGPWFHSGQRYVIALLPPTALDAMDLPSLTHEHARLASGA